MTVALEQAPQTRHIYTGPIFDGDMHVHEPREFWPTLVPERYKANWNYEYRNDPDGKWALFIGDRQVGPSTGYQTESGLVPPPGKLHEWLKAMKSGDENVELRVPVAPEMTERSARLALMDKGGVEGTIMFCGSMVATISYLNEIEPAKAILRSYNEWMLREWGFNHENRIYGVPILTLADLDWAVEQAKWVAENGARCIVLPMGPFNGKPPAHPDFDPFWEVLNEHHIGVTYHVSEAIYMKDHMAVWGEPVQQSRQTQTAFVWMHGYSERPVVETISSLIFWNFFGRFPNVKVMSVENGCEWVPAMLTKMDKCRGMAMNGYWPMGQLKERPSQIFLKNVYVVAYPEDDIKSVAEQTGSSDWIVMGSDYPHAEGVPTPRDFADEACQGMSDRDIEGVMYRNGRNFIDGKTNPGTR